MIIIGSKALNYHVKDYSIPNDSDFIGTERDILAYCYNNNIVIEKKSYKNLTLYCGKDNLNRYYEFEVAEKGRSSYDYLQVMNDMEGRLIYASLEILFSLKKSHINFEIKFDKHIKEYHYLKKLLNDDKLKEITTKRYNETKERLNIKLPKINQTVHSFFTESQSIINRIYEHDDIHRIVAHGDKPAYFKIQPDTTMVWCSKLMWNKLQEQEKIEMVLEEAYVISLERKLIPMLFQGGNIHSTNSAFKWALMRICTTLSSGYFKEFAVNNYYEIVANYNPNFVDKFLEEVEKDTVKYHTMHEIEK
jgi:Holliday junction resolvase